MKDDYQKPFKKSILFFLPHPVPFNDQSYQKQCPVALQTTKQGQKNSFISYILSDQVWWCNIKRLLSYFKNCVANVCKPIHGITSHSTSICPFASGKCGKEGKKLQKFEYLENKKSFFDEIKDTFHSFARAIIWWKNKIW